MRNILGLKIETMVGLIIVIMVVVIFLITIFRSIDNFNKFINRINQYYEELRIEKGK